MLQPVRHRRLSSEFPIAAGHSADGMDPRFNVPNLLLRDL
jgi:hypothetical protein